MSAAVRRAGVLTTTVLWLLVAGEQGCIGNGAVAFARDEALTWQSARMQALEKESRELEEAGAAERNAAPSEQWKYMYSETSRACARLVGKRLSYQDLRDLAASCDTLPTRFFDRQGGFSEGVLAHMVGTFVELGDRDALVGLLSKRFVSIMAGQRIEEYLANADQERLLPDFRGNRLKDPILVLGEAYSQCKTPEVRADIVSAVRRAFWGLGIPGKDDTEFVANAMRWYDEEKDHLILNDWYGLNELGPICDSGKVPDLGFCARPGGRQPLFLKADAARSDSGRIKAVLVIWLVHAGIAAVLCAPIVFLGRNRVRWRSWELLAVILPFSVWLLLMMSPLSMGRKAHGNMLEPFYFALGVSLAAIVRVSIGPRVVRQGLLIAALIGALCLVAAAVFFLVPPVLP